MQQSEEALNRVQPKGAAHVADRASLQLANLENALAEVQANKEIARVRLNFFKGNKAGETEVPSPTVRTALDQARDRLGLLEEKLATLREKYTDRHPAVIATEAELKEVQARVAAGLQSAQQPKPTVAAPLSVAERAAVTKQMADLQVELSSLEAKESVLQARIAAVGRTVPAAGGSELEAARLTRALDSQRSVYSNLSEKLGTVRVQEQAEGRGLRVIDLASMPDWPSHTYATRLMVLGMVLGLGCGIGCAALLEYFNRPVETDTDIENLLALPLLGWLPRVERRSTPSTAAGSPEGKEAPPVSFFGPGALISLPVEACRGIRVSLDAAARERPLQTLMVASAGPREGKSTVLLNLAHVLAESGRRVIIVDSDLRRPSLHKALKSHAEVGLVDLLNGQLTWQDARQPIAPDIALLCAGAVNTRNPASVLTPARAAELVSLLRGEADVVLFDSAPVLAVADNLVLATKVDGVVMIVRAGHTQQRDAMRAVDTLEKAGASIVGVVLNDLPPRATRHYYTQYGSYYGGDNPISGRWRLWNPRRWRRGAVTARRKTR
jgi:capsular exopolysaccharide synthesis family protein